MSLRGWRPIGTEDRYRALSAYYLYVLNVPIYNWQLPGTHLLLQRDKSQKAQNRTRLGVEVVFVYKTVASHSHTG